MTDIFDGYTSTATMARLKKPDLYYATSKFFTQGGFFFVEATEWQPKYFICHPDDYEYLQAQLKVEFTLIPLRYHQLSEVDMQVKCRRLMGLISEYLNKELLDALLGHGRDSHDDDRD